MMSDLESTAIAGQGSQPESQASQATATEAGSVGDATEVKLPGWAAALPADLKTENKLTQFEKVGDLGKAYLDLEGKLGSAVVVPGEDASEEEVQRFREKLGVPSDPNKYALKDLEDLPDLGEKLNPTRATAAEWFQPIAKDLGLTPEQAKGVFKALVERTKFQLGEAEKNRRAAAKSTQEALQGTLKDRYQATMNRANRLIKEFGGQEYFDYLSETGLANDPRQIRFVMKVADLIGDGAIPGGEAEGKQPFVTRGEGGLPNMGYGAEDFKS